MSALAFRFRKSFQLPSIYNYCCYHACKRYLSEKPALDEKWQKSPLKKLLDESANFEDTDPKSEQDVWATQPYASLLQKRIDEESGVDPEETSIILFPGQGTQYIGMGKDLMKFPKARELYKVAKDVIGFDLLSLSTEKELEKHSQLSVMVASLAAVERLREERPSAIVSCVATAGFSLGEITALVFAGALEFEQALKLVSVRAAAMEAASLERPGAMITVMYGADTNIKQVCRQAIEHCMDAKVENPYCCVANYLYPHCKVLSGCLEAIHFLEAKGRNLGLRKVKRLRVSGAFHSEGVHAAVEPMKVAMKLCHVKDPNIRVISGIDGKVYKNSSHIISKLPKQISHPVKWEQLLHNLYSRPSDKSFPRTFEVGPGGTLRTILRQVNARAWDNCLSIRA